jgi:hypothetical protein
MSKSKANQGIHLLSGVRKTFSTHQVSLVLANFANVQASRCWRNRYASLENQLPICQWREACVCRRDSSMVHNVPTLKAWIIRLPL